MEKYLNEIENALKAKLYTIALISALSLPDVCACLESPTPNDTSKVGRRYKQWYDKYAKEKCYLSAENCYKYRCSMVHSVNSTLPNSPHKKVVFFVPETCNAEYQNCTLNFTYELPSGEMVTENGLTIDLSSFVKGMIESVRKWLDKMQTNKNFTENYNSFLQARPCSAISNFGAGLAVF